MPVIRTMPSIKPVRTERTHEENQERAYIAASRRSDRSLEARVESARRASEIHKKRTGRSLRVREEDVMNEEMYEEEDDDLPMQYRRINALNPHLSYAFAERLNNYVNGQIGVRNVLQQAIAQSNQYQQNQQLLNSYMQTNGCYPPGNPPNMQMPPQSPSTWPTNMQGSPVTYNNVSSVFATPGNLSSYKQQHSQTAPNSAVSPVPVDGRRMSLPIQNMPSQATRSPRSFHQHGASINGPASPHNFARGASHSPQQIPSPTQSVSTPQQNVMAMSPVQTSGSGGQNIDAQIAPLTTKLPNETLQLLEGTGVFNPSYYSSQSTRPIGKYSYNPNGKSRSGSGSSNKSNVKQTSSSGLNQTLSPANFDHNQPTFPLFTESMAGSNSSMVLDMPFDINTYGMYSGCGEGENLGNLDFGSGSNSGFVTPNDATFGEFFDFQHSPERVE